MNNLTTQPNPYTFEAVWASLKKTERILKEQSAETDKRWEQTRQQSAEISKRWEQTRQEIKELNKKYGGMSQSNGEVAEEYFINSITKDMQFAGQEYESFDPNLSRGIKKLNLRGDFDLVLYNCSSVAIIEIKYKARKEDIEYLLTKPSIFRQLFPGYEKFNIYLGLAGLSVDKETEHEAQKHGIAILKQVGENMVINDANMKVF